MSEVSIVNQALALLGEKPLLSLDDDANTATIAKQLYAPNRDAVLEEVNWKFASEWFNLPISVTKSLGQYKNKFLLPVNVLRPYYVGEDGTHNVHYDVEGEYIVTNSLTCLVQAVTQITDTNKFSRLFTQALVQRLAAELAIAITASASLQGQFLQIYQQKIDIAISRNGIQGTPKRIRSNWLRQSRVGGHQNVAGPFV